MAHRLAQEAATELDDIWYYVAKESGSVTRADRLVDAITARFWILARHPHIGRRRNDLRPGLRSFPVRDYLIIYRTDGDDVLILHILHARRDITALLNERP
jgi:toxin ParE1/3/4